MADNGLSLHSTPMSALRTNRPFATAATADAANVCICSAGHFAAQHFSQKRSFKPADLGGSQTGLSLLPVPTNVMRANLAYAVLIFVWFPKLFSATALKSATKAAPVSAKVPKPYSIIKSAGSLMTPMSGQR